MLNAQVIQDVLFDRQIANSLADDIKTIFTRSSGMPMRHRRASRKMLSTNTERLRLYNVVSSLEDLNKLGYKIERARSLENRHVKVLVAHWVKIDLATKTMDNKISYLRWFVAAGGRKGMITELEDYLPDGVTVNRSRIAVVDKTFSGNAVDPAEVIKDALKVETRVGYILLLMLTFGLRVAEAAKMRVQLRLEDALQSATLVIKEGAKNGRRREFPLENWQQLDVLIDALGLVDGPHGSLIPYGKTWANWRLHFYRQVHKIGLKRDGELGLTPHSFRHENLNDLFYRVTGKPSPIHGGEDFDPARYQQAMEEVTRRAGHNDRHKSGAYLSTPRAMAKLAKSKNENAPA
jgi:integrase